MDLLDRIDRQIDAKHLLHHPFYAKWNEGTLPREALQEYARQYYAFESSFPRFLSALHSRTEDAGVRQHLLDNLWDEEHGTDNHAEMWLQFAEGIGVARDDVKGAPRNAATQSLVDLYREVTARQPVAEGVAAIYAYERQVPEVAQSKIDGLTRHYGIEDGTTLRFFEVHGVLDVDHSSHERDMLGELSIGADPEAICATTQHALDAWWDFLTAVDLPAAEPVAAGA